MTEEFKVILVLVLAVVLFVFCIVLISDARRPTFNIDDYEVKTIWVEENDTLGTYYARYADTNKVDRSEYINAILELNNLNSSMIYAGDKIKVYVQK